MTQVIRDLDLTVSLLLLQTAAERKELIYYLLSIYYRSNKTVPCSLAVLGAGKRQLSVQTFSGLRISPSGVKLNKKQDKYS